MSIREAKSKKIYIPISVGEMEHQEPVFTENVDHLKDHLGFLLKLNTVLLSDLAITAP